MSDLVERLEPCPFCGGKAEWHDITEADEIANIGGSCIVCTQCQACGPVQFGEKDTIVEHWNRRAESPELARLRSEVERLTRERDEAARPTSPDDLNMLVRINCFGDGMNEHIAGPTTVETAKELLRWAEGYMFNLTLDFSSKYANAISQTQAAEAELTTLTARTREVLAPFAELADQAAFLAESDSPYAVIAHHFRAANTLFNKLKEKDNG